MEISEELTLEEIEQLFYMLSGNKVVQAILRGQLLNIGRKKITGDKAFHDWRFPKFGHLYSTSTMNNFMNLARCYATENYRDNFQLSALYEVCAPQNDEYRDEIEARLADKKRVTKQDVIATVNLIKMGLDQEIGICEVNPDPVGNESGSDGTLPPDITFDDVKVWMEISEENRKKAVLHAKEMDDAAVVSAWLLSDAELQELVDQDIAANDAWLQEVDDA